MILLLYRILAVPLTMLALPFLAVCNRKLRRGLKLRLQRRKLPRFERRPVWIHAASGEFEYAKGVIREIKTAYPAQPIVATYFSPTFARQVEGFPGIDLALPLPLDLPGPVAAFLERTRPKLCLIARTDFWPELLAQTGALGIPRQVFSYTQKARPRPKWLARFRLGFVDDIACVSADDVEAIRQLGGVKARLSVVGDTRYDQVRFRLQHGKPLPEALKPPSSPCLIAGSTWPEDEAVLLPGLRDHLTAGHLRLILVPHEPTPEHIRGLTRRLDDLGLAHALYSAREPWSDKSVLLVDQVGVLAELYAWGDLAFVGGSFRKSVHSVMESLAAGCRTLVGPHHANNREALEFKALQIDGRPGLDVVTTADELRDKVGELLRDPAGLSGFAQALRAEVDRRQGASRRLLESLRPILEQD